MKRLLVKYRKTKLYKFAVKYQKHGPFLFFIVGFIWDSLTLGRIDRLYDVVVLCFHMSMLTFCLYFYNSLDSNKYQLSSLKKYSVYLPYAIQFFLGGLSSAYVIYFSRSVSLSKTATFFGLLILLFIANEFLRKRISNKYLQFGFYFFVSFIFWSCFLPIIVKEMSPTIFMVSGLISLLLTLILIFFVYRASEIVRLEIVKIKMFSLIIGIYLFINTCYYFKLIPPVPLALDNGLVAYNIEKKNDFYEVTYELEKWYYFWRDHKIHFSKNDDKPVYIFTSIFAPTEISKQIYHRWKWFDEERKEWKVIEDIGFEIIGGRDNGYRGYTFKNNIFKGKWKIEVVTNEDLVLGIVDFTINMKKKSSIKLVTEKF